MDKLLDVFLANLNYKICYITYLEKIHIILRNTNLEQEKDIVVIKLS